MSSKTPSSARRTTPDGSTGRDAGTSNCRTPSFLIKNWVTNDYTVRRVDSDIEGLIVLRLINKRTLFSITIMGSYLPPDSSTHAQNTDDYFQHLVLYVYEYYDDDLR